MDSRILTQEERKSLIEKIIENTNSIYLKNYIPTYIMVEGNTNLIINVDYNKTMPSVFILEYLNNDRTNANQKKQIITKNDMFYSPYFPCCIFLDMGILYTGSAGGLEKMEKVIICKDFDKKKIDLVNLISIDSIDDHISEDYKIKFDSIIQNYSLLSEK